MTLRLLVVDDESLARSRLRNLLGDCSQPDAVVVGEAANVVQAVELLQHHLVDAVLADIHMPGVDGLSLAQMLRVGPNPLPVVFVTAHAEHAVQAFDLEALDYLTKPVRLERLQTALQKIERHLQASQGAVADAAEEVLVIQERQRTERVPISQVLYLKAELKYITVRTKTRNYILEASLADLETQFASRFIRIHRNALVARRAVRALEKHHDPEEGEGWAVRLDGVEELLLVSRRQLPGVRALLVA